MESSPLEQSPFRSAFTRGFPARDSNIERLVSELQTQREYNMILVQQMEAERQRTQQLESFLTDVMCKKNGWYPPLDPVMPKNWSFSSMETSAESEGLMRTSSWGSFASLGSKMAAYEVLREVPSESKKYPPHVRQQKIARFKEKQRRHREKCPVSRRFTGRSLSARTKPRLNGKFVKLEAE
mmetsp:Transcript_6864/g.12487  ORF Transcript_6864/g.12487 Transcript_6864/m.12487 type:complete len:182 (+) Transcript_6864:3194-3739(+)